MNNYPEDETESYTGSYCPKCDHPSLESGVKTDFCTNPKCDYSTGYW